MCLSPRYIPNPSRRFTDGYSKSMIAVPCGHCKECLKMQENEWFVRSFVEYQRCEENGGHVYFVLLTYDDEHLPYYEDEDTGFTCPCFDPAHIKHFRDSLRVNLMRDIEKGIINAPLPVDDYQIKFMCCPEFGGKNGRSHYHNLLFIPFELPESYVIGTWKIIDGKKRLCGGLIEKCWPYGFVSWSTDPNTGRLRPFLEQDGGVEYCMKYVNKDDEWSIKYGIPEYRQFLKDQIKTKARPTYTEFDNAYTNAVETALHRKEYWEEKLKAFKRVMPRRYTSTNFGTSALRYYRNEDDTWNIDRLVDGRIDLTDKLIGKLPNPDKPAYVYNMPRYLKRKIMYKLDEHKLWKLLPIGVEVAKKRYAFQLKWASQRFAPYFNLGSMHDHLSYVKAFIDEGFNIDKDFAKIQKLMDGRSVDDLVLYDKVYRKIALNHDMFDGVLRNYEERKHYEGLDLNPFDPESSNYNHWVNDVLTMDRKEMMDYFTKNALDFYVAQITLDREPDKKNCARCKRKDFFKKRHGFECFDCFVGFDDVLDIIDKYETLVGQCVQEAHEVTQKRIKEHLAFQQGYWYNV